MARKWTSHPPGTVAIRLDVGPDVSAGLNELAGMASTSVAKLMRRVAEDLVNFRFVDGDKIALALKQTYLDAIAARAEPATKRPVGRPRKDAP